MVSSTPPLATQLQVSEPDAKKDEHAISAPPSEDLHSRSEKQIFEEPGITDSPAPTATDEQWVSGLRLLAIMAAITLVCLLMLMDASIIVTALPRITNDFHSLNDVGWYGSAYQLASAALQPLTGRVYSNLNSKWTFMGLFSLFELGSLLCAVAVSSDMLIVGRAVAGMGASGILTGHRNHCWMRAYVEKTKSYRICLWGVSPNLSAPVECIFTIDLVSQLGLILGPSIGGAITTYTSWRWCFYIKLPVGGLVVALLTFTQVPDQIPKDKFLVSIRNLPMKLDLIGFALFTPAAIELLLALQYGGTTFAWNSAQIIGLFCGAGGTFIVFMVWEIRKGEDAMIPISIIRNRIVWSSTLVYGFLMGQLFCTSYYLPTYFQGVKGASPMMSGVYILPTVLAHIMAAGVSGKLLERVGYYLPILAFGAVLISISNGLISTFSPHTSTGKWIGYQILLGAGRGIGLQMPIIAVQNSLPPAQVGMSTAFLIFAQSFAGALFLSFSDTIFTNSFKTLIPHYAPSVNVQAVIDAGASGFRYLLNGSELVEVLVAYAKSVDCVFYLPTGASVGCFMFVWFMGWKDIRKKPEVSKA